MNYVGPHIAGSGPVCHFNGSTFDIYHPEKNPSFVSINLPLTYGSVMGMDNPIDDPNWWLNGKSY